MKPIVPCAVLTLGLAASMWVAIDESYARGMRGGGGGIRAGGMSSVSRGGGGFSRSSSMGSGARASSRSSSGSSFSRPSSSASRGDRASVGTGANRGQINRGDVNRGDINRGDISRNDIRSNRGNVNIGNDINIDNDRGWGGWDDHVHHPIAAGMVVGATAAVTAAAVGSVYYSVPTGCAWGAYSYYWCDGYWLEPRYEGDTVVYVNVPDPRAASAP